MSADHLGQQAMIFTRSRAWGRLSQHVPLVQRLHDRVVAMQEQQVREGCLTLSGCAVLELSHHPATDIVMQLPVALRASPPQVGLNHVPGEIVGETRQSARTRCRRGFGAT